MARTHHYFLKIYIHMVLGIMGYNYMVINITTILLLTIA